MFETLVTDPIINLLLGFYKLFGNNLGWAIVFFTIFLKIVLLPLTIAQIKQQKKMMDLQPKIQALQSKQSDPSKMSPEDMALLGQTMKGFLGGCLPLLIQLPILIGLNVVIVDIASVNTDTSKGGDHFNSRVYFESLKHPNEYKFDTQFAGFDIARIPSQIQDQSQLAPYLVLIVLLVSTQFVQTKMMMARQQKKSDTDKNSKNRKNKKDKKDKKKRGKPNEKKKTKEELEMEELNEFRNKITQTYMTYGIPVAVGAGAFSFSAALGVYWLVQNVFSIIQTSIQYRIQEKRFNIPAIKEDFAKLSRFKPLELLESFKTKFIK